MSLHTHQLHFRSSNLEPEQNSSNDEPGSILSDEEFTRIRELVEQLWSTGHCALSSKDTKATRAVRAVLAALEVLGAVEISHEDLVTVYARTPFSRGFVRSFLACLESRVQIVDNWNVTHSERGDIVGSSIVLQAESQRVKKMRARGLFPPALQEQRAAFIVIKARTIFRGIVYLFDYNKNWDSFNLVGGKEEASDAGLSEKTALRELHEELGMNADSVQLTDLTPSGPIESYSTLGRFGVLTKYSTKFYFARMKRSPTLRARHRWFSLKELKNRSGTRGEQFLLHPVYFGYLLDPSTGIERLPNSFEGTVTSRRLAVGIEFISQNRQLIVAVIAILGAIIAVATQLLR